MPLLPDEVLGKLDAVVGTTVRPEAAVIYDWENRWAIDASAGPRREKKDYEPTCVNHYRPLWARGVPVDVIDMDRELGGYKLVIAPMLYMVRPLISFFAINWVITLQRLIRASRTAWV